MLPFMKPKHLAGLIIEKRKPEGSSSVEREDSDDQGLEACAEEIIRAISAKDSKSLALAIRSAFEILEMQPHEEVEHE